MKTFLKRFAVVCAVLFVALVCMGIVYIDTVQNFWRVGGAGNGYVQLLVSNKLVMSVSTNTGRIGIGARATNANTYTVQIMGDTPPTNTTGSGTAATTSGAISLDGAPGGNTRDTASVNGGAGARIFITAGKGGNALLAQVDATGGAGGNLNFTGGEGGGDDAVATNSISGSTGGAINLLGGAGGTPNGAATNNVGGNGGGFLLASGDGASPSGGWANKGGNGGILNVFSGNGGIGSRTNGGNGGAFNFAAGAAGSASTGGNAGSAGVVNIAGGDGADGSSPGTNSNGGAASLAGGAGGTGARAGNTLLGITSGGTVRGKVGVGVIPGLESPPFISKPDSMFLSNIVYTNFHVFAGTNNAAVTNITIDYSHAVVDLYLTNSATFTNEINRGTNQSRNTVIFISGPATAVYTLTFPNPGTDAFGGHWFTNKNGAAPLLTSFTGGTVYALSLTTRDTNSHASATIW